MTEKKHRFATNSQRYTPKYNKAISSYSAGVIFSISIFFSLYSLFQQSPQLFLTSLRFIYLEVMLNSFTSVFSIFIQAFVKIINGSPQDIFTPFVIGWFLGGFISGFIFGKKARGGIIEIIKSLFKTTFALIIVLLSVQVRTFSMYLNFSDIILIPGLVTVLVFLTIASIPLSLVALIGIQIGVMLKHV